MIILRAQWRVVPWGEITVEKQSRSALLPSSGTVIRSVMLYNLPI